jgi:hypothetical protein
LSAGDVSTGAGDVGGSTVNVCVEDVPPPGVLFVTDHDRAPGVAEAVMVISAVNWESLFTVVLLSAIPEPRFTEETP